jgi:hypothetical protein
VELLALLLFFQFALAADGEHTVFRADAHGILGDLRQIQLEEECVLILADVRH